jgi:uncharacterized membrane protein YfcA
MLLVVLMADQFGSKASTGLVIPMLSMADLMAVRYYRRDADWTYIRRLLPAAIVGILLGVWLGEQIDEAAFRHLFTWIILGGLVLVLLQERYPIPVDKLQHPLISGLAGLLGGFTTMVGNAAGPVMAVYLLATRLPKQQFIGTAAWFFLVVNLFKIPFHIWVWGTLDWSSFQLNLLALPAIVAGFLIGIRIVGWIPEKAFRYFIIIITTITALRMLLAG